MRSAPFPLDTGAAIAARDGKLSPFSFRLATEGVLMRKIVLLGASMLLAMLMAGGAALAVTPMGTASGASAATDQGALEVAESRDAALDSALKELVAMRGGPPGVIAVVQRGENRKVHAFGVANVRTDRRMKIDDRMRIASAAKAFSGATALSLVSKGALSLNDTIGERLPGLPDRWS